MIEHTIERWMTSTKCAQLFEWKKWAEEIPYIQFPNLWKVKAIPPLSGAIIRYKIRIPNDMPRTDDHEVSVYLDCYDALGVVGHPYWDVYPYHGDTGRCLMDDTAKLLEMIADREETSEIKNPIRTALTAESE